MNRLKQFLRIKWLLTVRSYTRRKWEGVLALATIAIVILAALLFGFVALFAAHAATDAPLRPLLSTTLWLTVALLILLPTLHLDIAGSLDLSQMLMYPLKARDFLVLALVDGVVSPTGLIMLAAVVPLTLAFAGDVLSGLVFVLLLILLFLFVVALSQLIGVVAMRLKASRRFVNLFLAVFAVLVIGGQFLAGYSRWGSEERGEKLGSFLSEHMLSLKMMWNQFAGVMHFAPPGAAVESYLGWQSRNAAQFIAWFAVLAGGTGLTLWVTGFVYHRLFKGELALAESPRAREGARARYEKGAIASTWWTRRMPAGLTATMRKEWRYLWREPHMKSQLIGVLSGYAYLAAVVVGLAQRGGAVPSYKGWIYLGLVYFLGMFTGPRFANKFGLDAEAIEVTFLTPIPRWQLLLGKGLPYMGLFASLNALAAVVAGALLGVSPLFFFCGILVVLTYFPLVDAVGNLVSIYFPIALVPSGGRRLRPMRQQQGCLSLFLHGLAINATQLLMLPISGMIALLAWSGIWLLAAPLVIAMAVYVYFVVRLCLRLAVRALAGREQEIGAFMLSSNR